ncbi:ATP-dependent helicase [Verrucomicrobiota bacterium]
MTGQDFRQSLNSEQYEAATAPDGPLLVLAAAGTGKTRALVYRVAYLVGEGVDPERILLLTFTNRAAGEMLDRARRLVGEQVSGVWGGTFHHMANRILRRHCAAIGYSSDYSILDRDDARTLVTACIKDLRLGGQEFPKPTVLLSLFSAAANREEPLVDLLGVRLADSEADFGDVLRVHEEYEARKRKLNAMDFDDMLINCLRLFREAPEPAERYRERFLHVLVDEYQDTNLIQAELVDRIASKHRNLMVVGDDFQSIYSWRGADFRNIMSFPERYPDAQTRVLETNYRSVPGILAVANACIAGNPDQYQKTLRATREAKGKPRLFRVRDGGQQARVVLEEIRVLKRNGFKPCDIAVLYRAHFHAMELQMELTREQLPYVITSGMRFFEQVHIKDVCSLVRILENPGDGLAFTRLLCLLPSVGEKTAASAWSKLGMRFLAADPGQREKVASCLRPAARPQWKEIERICEAYGEEGLSEDPGEVIHRFTKEFYAAHAANVFENADQRLEDIDELVNYTTRFDSAGQFLSEVALMTNLDAEDEKVRTEGTGAVRLSTVHQAKGLEWPAVIVIWATDGMFPSSRSMNESEEGEAEERRLFYVAVTRAKDELCLCAPEIRRMRDGGVMYCTPSRFIEEIPPDLLREERPNPFT